MLTPVDSVRIELNYRTPNWCYRITWCVGNPTIWWPKKKKKKKEKNLVTRSVIREAFCMKVKETNRERELEGFLIHMGYHPWWLLFRDGFQALEEDNPGCTHTTAKLNGMYVTHWAVCYMKSSGICQQNTSCNFFSPKTLNPKHKPQESTVHRDSLTIPFARDDISLINF